MGTVLIKMVIPASIEVLGADNFLLLHLTPRRDDHELKRKSSLKPDGSEGQSQSELDVKFQRTTR
jgi:hypothetical protein